MDLSIIIPTHRRAAALLALLDSIARQSVDSARFEIVIVDDGSPLPEHEALRREIERRFPALDISLSRQESAGPARARNQAIVRAKASLLLILNDDVTLDRDHFQKHLDAHAAWPEEHVVVRGNTRWAAGHPDTSVMRHLIATSFRTDYDLFDPVESHFIYFHTCDLSMKRSLAVEFPYDETFDVPCCEDTDLALRLLKAGRLDLRLIDAQSWHHHPHDLAAFKRRARMQGRAMALLLDRHPELEYRLLGGYRQFPERWKKSRAAWALLTRGKQPALAILEDALRLQELSSRHQIKGDGGPYPQRLLDALPLDKVRTTDIFEDGSSHWKLHRL